MIQTETLELLEWQRLCRHLSTFTATKLAAVAAQHLHIPTTPAETLQLLAQTQETYKLELRQNGLKFEGIEDISVYLERVERHGMLSGNELLAIATTLAGARQLRRIINNHSDIPIITEFVSELRTYPELEQEIYHCIDERGDVADRASVKLGGIRGQLRSIRDRVYEILQHIIQRKSNAVQEQLITQRSDRFVIPVKASQKDVIPGIVHDSSTTGATLYIEPKSTIDLNNQLRQIQRLEKAEEDIILQELSEQIGAVKPDLERLLMIVTTLDLAVAKARYSLWLEANPPRFIDLESSEDSTLNSINLRQLRHPLLVWQQQHEQGFPVVPIDVIVNPKIRVVAITGPNTGGKTVTLKTIGLAALMAKVGLFIPAREPVEIPWFDQVLADIGDEQSIEQNLSTFSGHIRRISRILEAINPQTENRFSSLILLDEVGAGTDPTEGSALAIALLQYLADHALLTIATTHFGELKSLKYEDERFENASVEFNEQSLQPTYRLLWGIPGRSNALTIAKRLGLNPEIIEKATGYVGETSEEVNQVIAGLEAQRRQQETKAQAAGQLLKDTERLHQELAQKSANLKERERELKQIQEKAIQETLIQAKSEIAKVIHRLQQGTPTGQDTSQATEALNQIAGQYLPSKKTTPKLPPEFKPKVGDRIRIPRFGQTAEVLSEPTPEGQITVRFGMMKMTVSLGEIESLDGLKPVIPKAKEHKKEPIPAKETKPERPIVRTSNNTIDLRGKRTSEAESELDRMLGQIHDFGAIWIIHGKGTGQLRKGVHEFLTNHPLVERFELAPPNDGGIGVTIAYLRN
ncbi:Endonuclease MutS2 [Planktothrix agardhii]|uniref:endonuclease MutS2 n=1 Tax=Planktothrix agardhii TaxID=1160 RepID=UPI0020A75077|nr:endonuclease MutS2 [Planktothrix agardhii]MDS1345130.1 endonuclease MutS2 [Planktothrix agardhii NRERC-751]CAD5940179.1 Endonuclease MutS2 [Planktothrix agardhii]